MVLKEYDQEKKARAFTPEEREKVYQLRFDRAMYEKHEEPVGTESFPGFTHNGIQALKEHALPKIDKESLDVIEVGVGEEGIGPYQFAHALEKEGREYNITATDIDKEVLESSKNLEELSYADEMAEPESWPASQRSEEEIKNKEEFKDFKEKINYEKGRMEIPEKWKENIDFEKSNMFYSAPKEQADIVNCSRTLYFYHRQHANLAFMNLVDMVKPGGFLHVDVIPTNDRTGEAPVGSEEQVEKLLDYDSYGLDLEHAEKGHAIFRKKQNKN